MRAYRDPTADIAIANVMREQKAKSRPVKKGDIFYIAKSVSVGSEQHGGRPAIVVSNNYGNRYSDCVEIVYLTTKSKHKLPTHVDIIAREPSTALCEQICTVSKKRLESYVRSLSLTERRMIDTALLISLGIETNIAKIRKDD